MSNNSVIVILDDFVKLVIRGFYTDEYAVVIDGLLREKRRIKDEELAHKLRLPQKLVRKVLSDLRADSLLKSSDIKSDPKPGERMSTQLLWYLDYKHIIDVVKYKIHMIKKKMELEKSHKLDVQSYRCTSCGSIYNAFDIVALLAMGKLQCENCEGPLVEEHNNESLTETTKHHSNLLGHLKKLVDQLRKTEQIEQIPLFARDIAENSTDASLNYIINTGSQGLNLPKTSAFSSNPNGVAGSQVQINTGNIEFLVEICESDNIDEINKTVKKESKKTGLASLPPWLLPSNSILNKSKTKLAERLNQPKEIPKVEPVAKKEVFDEELYKEYIKSHYKEWDATENTNKRVKLLFSSSNLNQNSNMNEPVSMDVDQKLQDQQEEEMEEDDGADNILIKVGITYLPITQITDEIQEKMTAQEYEDFHSKLYSYASKSMI